MMDRYPIIGLPQGMVLVVGRVFGPLGSADPVMLLDTGASITVITPRIACEVGLDPQQPIGQRRVYTYSGATHATILSVPRLRVFSQQVEGLEVICIDLPLQLKLDGVLGLNFLQHFDLRINFREGYLELR